MLGLSSAVGYVKTAGFPVLAAACVLSGAGGASADTITRNTIDRGWFDSTGRHNSDITNYVAGFVPFPGTPETYRNFFVIDLTAITEPVLGARLILRNPLANESELGAPAGFASPQGQETFTLFDVSTPASVLQNSQVGQTGVFADLGGGVIFGTVDLDATVNGTDVAIVLTEEGVAAVNAARGGLWAVGGAITTLDPANTTEPERLFAGTNWPNSAGDGRTYLELKVPAPGAAVVMLGLGALAARRRR
jgi:hypothetical protein